MTEFGPFDPDELVRWAETYGDPEEWAQKAKAAHIRAEEAERLLTESERSVGRIIEHYGHAAALLRGWLADDPPFAALVKLEAETRDWLDAK